jgi:hypothetical protein
LTNLRISAIYNSNISINVAFALVLWRILFVFQLFFVILQPKTLPRLVAGVSLTQEESPGSTGRPTSESGSYW